MANDFEPKYAQATISMSRIFTCFLFVKNPKVFRKPRMNCIKTHNNNENRSN